ncbi:MAG: tyrosine-type recombinase/integrase [Ruminococcus sp.]|nr:tyrosine-type recombinase/integrase [Ruminococcus sp.]
MKNPNGYGTVVKLSGNRRNPYAVRKTVGFNEKGYPVYLNIGYAPTKPEGLIMLAEYNKDPYDIDTNKITLGELFELWKEKRMPKLGKSNQTGLRSAYKHIRKYENARYNEIKSYHMQDCVDNCGRSYSTQGTIKNLWAHLDHFAMELDIISKCYSDLVTCDPIPETKKVPFTDEEVRHIWSNQQLPWVDSLLFLLYTRFRITEFINIEIANVDLVDEIPSITGGIKTEAGKNRIVPIHSKILPIVQRRIEQSKSGYLFEFDGKQFKQGRYRSLWVDLMRQLGMNHTPHECRHTVRSRLDSAGGNKVCIDRIMGHKSKGTGERIYTHKTISELKDTIELLD